MHLKNNFLIYSILVLTIIAASASYYRFMVLGDYIVSYEGPCDPETESCYVDCEDEECTTEYYYTVIERNAAEIFEKCGEDITDCDAAYECQSDAAECSITYCDPEYDGEDVCVALSDNSDSL